MTRMSVREWWDQCREDDQEAVLYRIGLDPDLAGIPWAFLPDAAREILARRVRIDEQRLRDDWQRTQMGGGA